MTMSRPRVLAGAVVALGALVALAVAFTWSRPSPAARGAESIRPALHPIDVIYAEGRLRRSVGRGAPSARLLVLTNSLLDLIDGDSKVDRRRAIDDALAALAGAGCETCEAALEQARP